MPIENIESTHIVLHPSQEEQQSILRNIWNTLHADIISSSKLSSGIYFNHTSKLLRELIDEAFIIFTHPSANRSTDDAYDALCLWYSYYKTYQHIQIPKADKPVYDKLYHLTNDDYPSVPNRWLTPKQLAAEYNFSESWQSKARMASSKSTLPFSRMGKFIRYDRYKIDQWIEEHQVQ